MWYELNKFWCLLVNTFNSTFQERLIQLKEQRVRLEQPRVRRSRSASTRTQSIRRTSLREKMNTTKKDVQDEKLYFIQSFDAMPKIEPKSLGAAGSSAGFDGHGGGSHHSNDGIVDINEVELTLAPTYFGSERVCSVRLLVTEYGLLKRT